MKLRSVFVLLLLFFLLPAAQSSLFSYFAMPPFLPLFAYAGLLVLPLVPAIVVSVLGAMWYDFAFSLPLLTSVVSIAVMLVLYMILSRLLTGSTFVAAHTRALVAYVGYIVGVWAMGLVANRIYSTSLSTRVSIIGSVIGYLLLACFVELVRRRHRTEQLLLPFFQR